MRLGAIDVVEQADNPADPVAAAEARAEFDLEAAGLERARIVCLTGELALQDRDLAVGHGDHQLRSRVGRLLPQPFHDLVVALDA